VASWNLQVVNAAALERFSPWFLILAENPFSQFDLQSLDYCPQDGGFLSSMQTFSNQDYLEKKTCTSCRHQILSYSNVNFIKLCENVYNCSFFIYQLLRKEYKL